MVNRIKIKFLFKSTPEDLNKSRITQIRIKDEEPFMAFFIKKNAIRDVYESLFAMNGYSSFPFTNDKLTLANAISLSFPNECSFNIELPFKLKL